MDVERTMEFILEQQAQFANQFSKIDAALLELSQSQKATEEALSSLAQHQSSLAQHQSSLAQHQSSLAQHQSSLAQHQLTTQQAVLDIANAQERTNEILATLAERQITTEENLNALLLTVERHIANHK